MIVHYKDIAIQDNFDISYILDSHGWSAMFLFVDERWMDCSSITHIYSSPVHDLLECCMDLLNGELKTTFTFYGEPGTSQLELIPYPEARHLMKIHYRDYMEDYPDLPVEIHEEKEFNVRVKTFLIQVYFQLEKMFYMLKDPGYAKERQSEFPFEEFPRFREKMKKVLKT